MLRKLFFKKKNNPIKLGRWGTSINRENDHENNEKNNENYLQADLSNHDHCGSDICGTPTSVSPTSSPMSASPMSASPMSASPMSNKLKQQNRKYFSVLTNNDEYYLPFLIPCWHVNFENKNINKKKSKKEVENWSQFLNDKKKKLKNKNKNKKQKQKTKNR